MRPALAGFWGPWVGPAGLAEPALSPQRLHAHPSLNGATGVSGPQGGSTRASG